MYEITFQPHLQPLPLLSRLDRPSITSLDLLPTDRRSDVLFVGSNRISKESEFPIEGATAENHARRCVVKVFKRRTKSSPPEEGLSARRIIKVDTWR